MPIICHDPKHAVFCRSLQQLPRSTKRFAFYPFTNEENYAAVLKSLHKLPILPTEGRAVALLVGESNILSLLPDLATKVTIILCNDINPRMNAHTHLLIKCLLETTDIEEFRHLYFSECELMGIERAEIEDHMQTAEQDLGGAYVLSSPERFQVCQDAARKLTFVWASIDLLCQQEVQLLVDTLHGYKANISFMNVSNIHHYCDEYLLAENLKILLQGKNAYIMFSCSLEGKDTLILRTKLVASFSLYCQFLRATLAQRFLINDSLTFQPTSVNEILLLAAIMDKANQKIETIGRRNHQLLGCEIPKISMTKRKDGLRFFSLNKATYHTSDEFFMTMARQLLSAFYLQWFFVEEDFLQKSAIEISFTFLLSFVGLRSSAKDSACPMEEEVSMKISAL